MNNPFVALRKRLEDARDRKQSVLQQKYEELQTEARKARGELNKVTQQRGQHSPDLVATREQLESISANADLAAAKAHHDLMAYRQRRAERLAKTQQRAARFAAQNEKWRTRRVQTVRKWSEAKATFAALLAETRKRIEDRLRNAPGKGAFRTLRALQIKATGYTTLGVTSVILGVSVVLEAVLNTVAAGGPWLLSRISGVLGEAWSALFRYAAWTVRVLFNVVSVLITSAVAIVLVVLELALDLVILPVVVIRNSLAERRASGSPGVDPGSALPPAPAAA